MGGTFLGYTFQRVQDPTKENPGECMWTIWTLATGSSGLSPHGLYSFGIGHLESPGSADFPSQSVDGCWVVLRSSTVTQFIIMFPLKLWDVLGGIATPAKDFKVRSYLHFSGTTFLFLGRTVALPFFKFAFSVDPRRFSNIGRAPVIHWFSMRFSITMQNPASMGYPHYGNPQLVEGMYMIYTVYIYDKSLWSTMNYYPINHQ